MAHTKSQTQPTEEATENDRAWDHLFQEELAEEFTTPEILTLAHRVKEAKKAIPSVVGYEVDDIGIVELVWENEKIAVILPSQEPCRETLTNEGWKVFMYDDEALLNALKEG